MSRDKLIFPLGYDDVQFDDGPRLDLLVNDLVIADLRQWN